VRFDGAKDGQQAIPRILEDAALVRLDDRREALERSIDDGVDILGIEPPAQHCGADHVREQDRHGSELLLRRTESGEFGSQRGERRVDDGVAQNGALRLQGGDAAFELFSLRHVIYDSELIRPAR
jgi:hypothetical protein